MSGSPNQWDTFVLTKTRPGGMGFSKELGNLKEVHASVDITKMYNAAYIKGETREAKEGDPLRVSSLLPFTYGVMDLYDETKHEFPWLDFDTDYTNFTYSKTGNITIESFNKETAKKKTSGTDNSVWIFTYSNNAWSSNPSEYGFSFSGVQNGNTITLNKETNYPANYSNDKVVAYNGGSAKRFGRNEIFIDSSSLNKVETDGTGEDQKTVNTKTENYLYQLKQIGWDKLHSSECLGEFSADISIDPQGVFKVGEDYTLGDTLNVKYTDKSWTNLKARVVAITFSTDETGTTLYPEFEVGQNNFINRS